VDRKDPAPAPSDPAPKPEYTSEANPLRFGYEPEHVPDIPPISAADPKPSRARPAPPRSEPKPAASDGPEEFEPLKETLADKVTETITFNKEFDALAEAAAPMLGQIGKEITDFNDLKQLLVKGLDDLIRERTELRERLTSAASYLRSIESDRQQMRAEIGKLRKHNLVDELTGLPRRELFVKNLESEISRVRRYGFSLVLAVLDIDELDRLNRDFGRDAGDAALRCYATDILSGFRQYDLIARYGEDEFAILFPNTQKEGAIRALEKAQKRTAETFLTLNERTFGLPGFSSVITLFAPGDKASTLLARASEALDRAKHAGSTRIVLALPTA
jgi:diguanylate cyclase